MKSILVFLIITSSIVSLPTKEGEVFILNKDNYDEELKQFENLLIKYYAPWCGHCKRLAPEYEKAAKMLNEKGSNVYLAKVDAEENAELGAEHSGDGYPTLKFWTQGKYVDYTGGTTAGEIIAWITKITQGPVTVLTTKESVKDLADKDSINVVYFDKNDTSLYKVYETIAKNFEKVSFYRVEDSEIASEYNLTTGNVLLFKNFDEKTANLSKAFTEEELTQFINENLIPLINEFNEKIADVIFGQEKIGFILFRDTQSPEQFKLEDKVRQIANKFKGKLYFVICDIKNDLEEKVAEYYGVTEKDLPQIRITDVKGEDDIKNYLFRDDKLPQNYTDITAEEISQFITDVLDKKISPFLKSEEIPETQNTTVHKIVGKSFNDLVINSKKNVLLELYAPWCGHCKRLEPIYERLAELFKEHADKLLIAKMDAILNEVQSVDIQGFPTIFFYEANNKEKPITYEEARNLNDLISFLNTKLGTDVKIPEGEVTISSLDSEESEIPHEDL